MRERRLRTVAEYARSEECRSVFLRRYFGEEAPPRRGTCDRCRASARQPAAGGSLEIEAHDPQPANKVCPTETIMSVFRAGYDIARSDSERSVRPQNASGTSNGPSY
jgi:superfamily II DNA helicase RecQ